MRPLINCLMIMLLFLSGCGTSTAEMPHSSERESTLLGVEDISFGDSPYENAPVQASKTVPAMDTVMTLTVYADSREKAIATLNTGANELHRLEDALSVNREGSAVSRFNRDGNATLDDEGIALMKKSLGFYESTGGLFNIAIYPLVRAWGFTTDENRVPDDAELQKLLPLCNPTLIRFDEGSGKISAEKEGMGIDFGGIAKGYAGVRLMEIFRDNGIQSGLVSLGGNVQLLGQKPDSSPYRVAIEDPADTERYLGTLAAEDCAVITSGSYQRFFEADGKRYHHIINPETGKPADSDLHSVSVVCKDGSLGDAYATTLFILGYDDAVAFWRANRDLFDMILVNRDHEVFITDGIADAYTPWEGAPTPQVIGKEA